MHLDSDFPVTAIPFMFVMMLGMGVMMWFMIKMMMGMNHDSSHGGARSSNASETEAASAETRSLRDEVERLRRQVETLEAEGERPTTAEENKSSPGTPEEH